MRRRALGSAATIVALAVILLSACMRMEGQKASGRRGRHVEEGMASWYGLKGRKVFEHGKLTASGARYDMHAMTAAHKTLPLGSRVKVTNLENGRTIVVVINDRGPYIEGRIIDLTLRGARKLKFEKKGTARVRVEVLR